MTGHANFGPSEAASRILQAFGDGHLEDLMRARRMELKPGLFAGMEEPLVSLDDLQEALAHGRFIESELRVAAGRTMIDKALMQLADGSRIDLRRLEQLARQGITMVLNKVDWRIAKVGNFARALGEWLGERIEVVSVASFGNQSGYDEHYDEENVFIVQLEGAKHWTFFGEPLDLHQPQPVAASEVTQELVLNAGDVMFLPSGLRHVCSAVGHSLHLGVLIKHVDGSKLAKRIAAQIVADPYMKVPNPVMLGEAEFSRQAEAYRQHIHALVDRLDFAEELRREQARKRYPADFRLRWPD
ncbi:MAG: hypothetical protein KGL44_05505 [Sphingomonadales bacterium]|nr:hypothetical protein [Sphingomonadales bacterium]